MSPIVPRDLSNLNTTERNMLQKIYDFSKQRNFQFGLNQRYAGGRALCLHLQREGLIFYIKKYNNYYWFPSELGRQLIEEQSENV